MLGVDLKIPLTSAPSFDGLVSELVAHFKDLWWNCERSERSEARAA